MSVSRCIVVCAISLSFVIITGCGQKGSKGGETEMTRQNTQEETIEAGGSVQQTCPVTGRSIDEDLSVDYNDVRVYVCSEECIEAFNNNPERYLKKLEELGEVPKPLH